MASFKKVTIDFSQPHVNGYGVYTVKVNDKIVANIYGSMAAIATEAIARYFESDKDDIKVRDVFERFDRAKADTD